MAEGKRLRRVNPQGKPSSPAQSKLGWIGTGRMGYALASRLLQQGCDLAVYNRTRSKAEPLAKLGARIVDRPSELADREIVMISVADSPDFAAVMTGPGGLLSNGGPVPRVVVDTSTVSMDVSRKIREHAGNLGAALLAAPVSGNAKVARAGKLTMAVSALVHQIVVGLIGSGLGDQDFATLLDLEARSANLKLEPDSRHVPDGLAGPS